MKPIAFAVAVLVSVVCSACDVSFPAQEPAPEAAPAPRGAEQLLGNWIGTDADAERLEFRPDGTLRAGGAVTRYRADYERLAIEAGDAVVTGTWTVVGPRLSIALTLPDGSSRRGDYLRATPGAAVPVAAAAPQADGDLLAGLEFGHSSFGSGSSLTCVYTFGAGGRMQVRRMFSSSIGGSDSTTPGTFQVRGDTVTMRVGDEVVQATIERDGTEVHGLRIGAARYART